MRPIFMPAALAVLIGGVVWAAAPGGSGWARVSDAEAARLYGGADAETPPAGEDDTERDKCYPRWNSADCVKTGDATCNGDTCFRRKDDGPILNKKAAFDSPCGGTCGKVYGPLKACADTVSATTR